MLSWNIHGTKNNFDNALKCLFGMIHMHAHKWLRRDDDDLKGNPEAKDDIWLSDQFHPGMFFVFHASPERQGIAVLTW